MKTIFTLLVTVIFNLSAFAQCTELFFSEYSEGSANNKYAEIYNPSNSSVDMSTYSVVMISNGGPITTVFELYGTLDSDDVFIFCTDQADATILASADTAMSFPSVSHFNGDDCLVLVSGTDTIDQIGTRFSDPGSSWTVGSGSTKEFTLIRKESIESPDTAWATTSVLGWDVLPQNDWSNIGSHTSNCPKTNDIRKSIDKLINVYPNPAYSNLTIAGTTIWERFTVYGLLGVEVAKGNLNNNNLSVSELSNGAYILKLQAGERNGIGRFVISK